MADAPIRAQKVTRGAHTIPKSILHNFVEPNQNCLWMYLREKPPIPLTPGNAATRSYFYAFRNEDGSRSNDLESALSVLEGRIPPIIEKVIAKNGINIGERDQLARYCALQLSRTPGAKEATLSAYKNYTKRALVRVIAYKHDDPTVNPEEFPEELCNDDELHSFFLAILLSEIKQKGIAFYLRKWRFWRTTSDIGCFILSSMGVAIDSVSSKEVEDIRNESSVIYIPLHPQLMLEITGGSYDPWVCYAVANRSKVEQVNRMMALQTDQAIFANTSKLILPEDWGTYRLRIVPEKISQPMEKA